MSKKTNSKQDNFASKIDAEIAEILSSMNNSDNAMVLNLKEEVDRVVKDMFDVLATLNPKLDPQLRTILANRATSYIHSVVSGWVAEGAVASVVLRKEQLNELVEDYEKIRVENELMRTLLAQRAQTKEVKNGKKSVKPSSTKSR